MANTGIKISHQTVDKLGRLVEIHMDDTGTRQLEPEELMEVMIARRKKHHGLSPNENSSNDENLPIK